MKLTNVVTVPFKPDIPLKSYMLLPQLAPQDEHIKHLDRSMRAAFTLSACTLSKRRPA